MCEIPIDIIKITIESFWLFIKIFGSTIRTHSNRNWMKIFHGLPAVETQYVILAI